MNRRWLIVPMIAVFAIAAVVAAQETGRERTEQGRKLFTAQGCYGCHVVQKFGTPIGPDLSHVGAKYSEAYLKNWLRDPAAQRPSAHMPRLELTEEDITTLAAFLASLD